ncbi:MAG: Trm112 family protein [Actinomycetia bacterium]|nr:Trm112 family protein [Actinomycetes bacterium]
MTEASNIDPELLTIIVCPQCHGQLQAIPETGPVETLACSDESCGLHYPVRDGIPILLVDEAGHGS